VLATCLFQFTATLEIVMVAFVIGRFIRHGGLEDLGAQFGEVGPDLRIGEGLVLRLEGVRLVDHGLEASDLAVVRVDEPVQESHIERSIGEVVVRSRQAVAACAVVSAPA
jgi:hypothetical protein